MRKRGKTWENRPNVPANLLALSMRITAFPLGGYQLTCYETAASPTTISQDSWLAIDLDNRQRVAVIDGVTPTLTTPAPLGDNGAVWAAGIVRTALATRDDTLTASERANALLHRPQLPGREQSSAALAVIDLSDGQLQSLVAGDCHIWIRDGADWQRLSSDALTPAARQSWSIWLADHVEASQDERFAADNQLLGSEASWQHNALGRFETIKTEQLMVRAPDEIVLATDGARLNAECVCDLDRWLTGLRDWERSQAQPPAGINRHDDVTVISMQRRSAR
jgi:hypothetical protein